MKSSSRPFLCDPVLEAIQVAHGFGTRGAVAPDGTLRAKQVHGNTVARLEGGFGVSPTEADALLSRDPNQAVAIVTADCVPILLASANGQCVAAVHAGWRGLVCGIIPAAIAALSEWGFTELRAAIGPHARACCYEVDAPVLEALEGPFGSGVAEAIRPGRPGHAWLDLQTLALQALSEGGIGEERCGTASALCTVCRPELFDSFRREGDRAGRLIHWVRPVRNA